MICQQSIFECEVSRDHSVFLDFCTFWIFSHDDRDYDEDDNDNKDDEANVPKMLWLRNLVEKCWMLFGGGDSFCSISLILDPKKPMWHFFKSKFRVHIGFTNFSYLVGWLVNGGSETRRIYQILEFGPLALIAHPA